MSSWNKSEFYLKQDDNGRHLNIGKTNLFSGKGGSWPGELHYDEHEQMKCFLKVIQNILGQRPMEGKHDNPSMIELGHSSHSAYSQTFNHIFDTNCVNICVEPIKNHLVTAQDDWKTHNLKGFFYHGYAGLSTGDRDGPRLRVKDLMSLHNIETLDILHMDIEGAELDVLLELEEDGIFNKIRTYFISTHHFGSRSYDSRPIHEACQEIIQRNIFAYNYLFNSSRFGGQNDGCIIITQNQMPFANVEGVK